MSKTFFVTGASRGLGRELCEQALSRGDRVAATARQPSQLDDLVAEYGDRLWVSALDVTDTDAVREVVGRAFADLARIDVVVSNAGYGVAGAAEELTDAQVESMLATNLTASIHLARAITPHLREQGDGHLMQMSSMGAFIAFPGFALYHAAKWGIEGFLQAWAGEVEPFGITTTLVEPGMVRTTFYDAIEVVEVTEPYRDHPLILRGNVDVNSMVGDQAKVVAAILDAADSPTPPLRLLLGSDAYQMVTEELDRKRDYFVSMQDVFRSTDIEAPPTSADTSPS